MASDNLKTQAKWLIQNGAPAHIRLIAGQILDDIDNKNYETPKRLWYS